MEKNLVQAVPFYGILNMETSLKFYVDGLGFTMLNSWTPRGRIEWCWLDRDGVAIMLQESRNKPVTEKIGLCINFTCRDSIALYHEFRERGLTPGEPQVGNNLWVTTVTDPDGYKLFFNSPTDVPEETLYSEWLAMNKKT
jgi:lactoylglutathione lyase